MHRGERDGELAIPRARARGLIEARRIASSSGAPDGQFRERALAASLKLLRLDGLDRSHCEFRERALAASLKQRSRCGTELRRTAIPRARARGLIEARSYARRSRRLLTQFRERALAASLKQSAIASRHA